MRRLPLVLIALPLSLVLAVPASALTPESGSYKGSGKSTCVTDPVAKKREKCSKATVKVTVSKGYITKVNIKLGNGFSTDTPITKDRKVKISAKGKFSFKLTISSETTYALKGKFSSSTKLSGTYSALGGLSTEDFPKTTFTAQRK